MLYISTNVYSNLRSIAFIYKPKHQIYVHSKTANYLGVAYEMRKFRLKEYLSTIFIHTLVEEFTLA